MAEVNKLATGYLRYGSTYYFGHLFSNNSEQDAWITEVDVNFTYRVDFNGEGESIQFPYSEEISKSRLIPAGKQSVPLVKSSDYSIRYHAPERATGDETDIEITYTVNFVKKLPDGSWEDEDTIIEDIQPFVITRCGDGTIDRYNDVYTSKSIYEQCDPNDVNEVGWGKRGCSLSCKILD
jgi:hypothetical protein